MSNTEGMNLPELHETARLNVESIKQICKGMGLDLNKTNRLTPKSWEVILNRYIEAIHEKLMAQSHNYDLNLEKARLARSQTMNYSLKAEQLAAASVPLDVCKNILIRVFTIISKDLEGIPRTLRVKIRNLDTEVVEEVTATIDRTRVKMYDTLWNLQIVDLLSEEESSK